MNKSTFAYCSALVVSIAGFLTLFSNVGMASNEPTKLPSARKIPGLTVEDKFPNGCVDCHINMPEIKQDERFSTLMSKLYNQVEPELLKKAQAVAPDGIALKGIHPQAAESLNNIPDACIACHSEESSTSPPLVSLLHAIHLSGGENNHFLTIFQGECTHCHKLNASTGTWMIPSGPEKQ